MIESETRVNARYSTANVCDFFSTYQSYIAFTIDKKITHPNIYVINIYVMNI